jgi:tripartite-type tricarboxylate transporter receptor subunit TctC
MKKLSRRSFAAGLTAAGVALTGRRASAQTYPTRLIRIFVPFTAGGSSDTLARIMGETLQGALDQTVIVENRPGGNSTVGMLAAAGAPADGYTMIQGHIGTHAISPAISPPTGYDVSKTFATVAMPATSSNLLVVRAGGPIDSMKTFLELAKAKPGSLNYGSPGVGSPSHISVLQLAALTGINVVHVAYRGNSAAITDMLNGTLDFMFASPAECIEQVRAGKLKALGASAAERSAGAPDIAPLAELGVPGFNFRTWHVMSMRSDTPPEILARMRSEISKVIASDAYRKRLAELSLDPGISDGVEAEKYVQSEIEHWRKFVKDNGIQPG